MTDQVTGVLDALVPGFVDEQPDWPDVVARANDKAGHSSRKRRWSLLVAAALVLVLGALLATPAFGVQGLVRDLLGRKNVSFPQSASAPNEVKKEFQDLIIGAPPGWAQETMASQARIAGTFAVAGRSRKLFVVPTRRGGYCYMIEQDFGGCRQRNRDRSMGANGQSGNSPLGVTWTGKAGRPPAPSLAIRVGGDIAASSAAQIVASYADGTTASIPFVWVSRPINAGFYSYDIPAAHQDRKHRLLALTLYAADGRRLDRRKFIPFQPQALAIKLLHPPSSSGPMDRRLPVSPGTPPSRPVQTGDADGFSVIVGHNGAVQFTQTRKTPVLQRLIGHSTTYGCFRLAREFGIFSVLGVGQEARFAPKAGFLINGVRTPLDGCEIQASNGHTWPDSSGNHSVVEIPLTPVGRRFFTDRAAARDLALFVRSRRVRQLRKEPATRAVTDIHAAYRRSLAHSPIRVTTIDPTALRFSETSSTGKRFYVTTRNGSIKDQNLEPYAFVF